MPVPAEKQDRRLMRQLFSTVAPRYDFITRAFSYGMDMRWKRLGVALARLPHNSLVLDLASGTGDFSRLVREFTPSARVVATDLTHRMLVFARERQAASNLVCADATSLPFSDNSFDCVFVGYGLRNFSDLSTALGEIRRVTRTGGLLVTLDFFLPVNSVLRNLYLGYLYAQGVFWGTLLHRSPRVYTYIPNSLRSFVSAPEFSTLLASAGYRAIRAREYVFGGIGLHWGVRE
jgi:demethylmenaquinone methyltransferase/2-methoxy-6-polyprenyl-1,4-benzoquinol methylase